MKRIINWIKNNKIAALLVLAYVLSLIPLLAACVYVYPQADDWRISWTVHAAWVDTHSLWAVLRAVAAKVASVYMTWEGTYATFAIVAMQPAVWGIRAYCIVPFVLIGLLTVSTLVFVKELFRNVKSSAWLIVSMVILLVTVQCMPSPADAFYWFDGAIHYIGMYSCGLFLLTCVVKCIRSDKWRWGMCVLSCLFAMILGGGNMTTGLVACIGYVALIVALWLLGRKEKICRLLPSMVFMYAGFLVNLLAPGNAVRQTYLAERENPILAIIKSLHYGVEYGGGKWFTWIVLLMIAILIPVAWKAVGQMSFTFPCPLLVLGFSYCLFSAMFTPTEYAFGYVDVGRCLNVTYIGYVLFVAMDVLYITGWCRKRGGLRFQASAETFRSLQKWYIVAVVVVGCAGILFTILQTPKAYTTTLALYEFKKGTLQETNEIIQENLAILQSDEKDVTIRNVPKDSLLLRPQDIDPWESGTDSYFGKDSVTAISKDD